MIGVIKQGWQVARGTSQRGGSSRIRFILVEADLQDGDLEQVTQVLQNAFRTTQAIPTPRQISRASASTAATAIDPDTDETLDLDDSEQFSEGFPSPTKQRAARKIKPAKVPVVINDIDVKADPSLKNFVEEFDLKSAFDKYLVIALWFRDGRNIPSITVDHVYTCFKLLGWSTTSNDFSKPLRNLRHQQSLSGDAKGYSLTLPGAGRIEDKKRSH